MSAAPVRRARGARFRIIAVAFAIVPQVPAVCALAHFLHSWPIAAGGAALLSLPYMVGLRSPFEDRPKSALHLYGGLLPFFFWWASCLAFALFAPLALAIAWALHGSLDRALALAGAGALLAGLRATWRRPRTRRIEVEVAGLPAELDGYRIGQLSDVHLGTYNPERRVARWVTRLNRERPDLMAVTGDLISSGDAYVAAAARALGGLRAPDGVFACMGNHDYFTDGEELVTLLEQAGLAVLRNRGLTIEHDGARLYVAGADDTWTRRADVARALAERPADVPALLLAHDPNLFPQAAAAGVALTLSGHTHGGQFALPVWSRRLNLARIITRFPAGLYYEGEAALYVSRGAGTTGPPVRLGAPAELTVLTLRAA